MADEISQVVEMECKGVYYLLKGSKEAIATMIRWIKALSEKHHNNYLNKPGNCDWKKMQEISNGTPPILEFPKEMFVEKVVGEKADGTKIMKSDFDLYCEKYDLRYCIMPDLNPNDDYIPVAVPAQDVGIHKEQIKAVMERRIMGEESKDKELDEEIAKAKEAVLNASTPAEKEKAEAELNMLLDAKSENEGLLKESKDKMEHENEIDFAEYLKQGEGYGLAKEPEKALAQDAACGIVREYTPYDCMWPVRDEAHVPESGEIFYSQTTSDEKIHMIKREFKKDDHGHIFSEYKVRIPGTSETMVYSDYGLSKEQWKMQIPGMLEKAGLVNGEMTAVVQSEERFKKYQDYVEANFKKASVDEPSSEKVKEYSSAEAKEFVTSHNENQEKKASFEESMYSTITVPVTKVMPDGEDVMCLELEEGLVKGVIISAMDDKEAHISIKDDATYSLVKPDGTKKEIAGSDITAQMSDSVKEAVTKVAGKGRK